MGDSVEIATCEILTDRHANLAQGPARSDTLELRTGRSELRMQGLESGLRQDRRNAAGMLAMMRATAGDFDARVGEVEERVAALESRTGRGSSAERMPCAASKIDREQGTRQSDTIQLS